MVNIVCWKYNIEKNNKRLKLNNNIIYAFCNYIKMISNSFLRKTFYLKEQSIINKSFQQSKEKVKEINIDQDNSLFRNLIDKKANKSFFDTRQNSQCSSNLYSSPCSMPNIQLHEINPKAKPIIVNNSKRNQIRLISKRDETKPFGNNSYTKENSSNTHSNGPFFKSKSKSKPRTNFILDSREMNDFFLLKKKNKEKCNEKNISLRTFSYHINTQYKPHQSFNLIRNFLSNKAEGDSAFKLMIRYKAINHLTRNYSSFVRNIINNYKKYSNEKDNIMNKQRFAQHNKLYRKENFKDFIDDIFLLFDVNNQERVDNRFVYSVFTIASDVIKYKDAINNVIACWESKGLITWTTIVDFVIFVLPERNKKKQLVDVIKNALSNIDITMPYLNSETVKLNLQNSNELENLINRFRLNIININSTDSQLNKKIMKVSRKMIINAQYEINKKNDERHFYNEMKKIEKNLHSLSILHYIKNKEDYNKEENRKMSF